MEIGVAGPIFTHKNDQRLYLTTMYILYMKEENIVVIIHIYRDIAILQLFCDNQYTESEE